MKNILKTALLLVITTILSFAGNKKIIVDLTKQEAYAYSGKSLLFKGWISSGKYKHTTPVGVFRILEKDIDHVSNEWPKPNGGAKMKYMLRLTWSGIAMHLGYTPNRPASHGCIRLKNGFAQKLYRWADVGVKVIIKGRAPKRVARRGRGFVEYNYVASAKKRYKKTRRYKIVKSKKRRYLTKRKKLIKYYSKFTHKKLNRLLRKNKRKKRLLLSSLKYSKYLKAKKLKEIKKEESILRAAKSIKYKSRTLRSKKLAKKRYRKHRKKIKV